MSLGGSVGSQPPQSQLAPEEPSRLSAAYARLIVRLRWVVVLFWVGAVAACTVYLPIVGSSGDEVASIIPVDSPALRAEFSSIEAFGFPLTSRTVIVQRDPNGLSPYIEAESVLDALAVNQQPQRYPLLGALPLTNTFKLFPAAAERDTTVLTYLFMNPRSGFGTQQRAAQRYIDANLSAPADHTVGVAGSVPARAQQADLVARWLPALELLTILAIVLLVGLNYRAVLPPVMALTASAVAFLVTLRMAGLLEQVLGVSVPAELEPLLVALLLGVVTDYTIFYLSAFRNQLTRTGDRRRGAIQSIASFTPIVLAAGITVAAGTAALLAANSSFFKAVGPALALAILIGLVVSVTLIPALIAILGRAVFWPSTPGPSWYVGPASDQAQPTRRLSETAFVVWLVDRRHAALVLVGCVGVLVVASLPLAHLNLGIGFTQSLPSANPVKVASNEAAAGFAPGITSPTTILVEAGGITSERQQLNTFQDLVEAEQGIAGVVGPADNLAPRAQGIVLATSGDAARLLVVFDHDPLEAVAIDDLTRLQERMPDLVRQSGLQGALVSIAGDTALAAGLVDDTEGDLFRIAVAAIVVNFLLLAVFLRALVAPVFLLASSILALSAAMGLTTLVFQDLFGGEGITFYVPFAAAVLLIALGSDYNIFGVGHVWELARHMSLKEAITRAMPESTRAIAAAGITLAVSFGMLVIIPLRPFRELAFAMAIGILMDVVVIRSLVTPSMLVLVGPISGWPGGRFKRPKVPLTPLADEGRPRVLAGRLDVSAGRSDQTWRSFLECYHESNAGITEQVLSRALAEGGLTPYSWLGEAIAGRGSVLEVGCGSAPMAAYAADAYVGVDLSRTELDLALARGRGAVVQADGMVLPLTSGQFDAALAPMSLMLFDSPEHALDEIARVLKPGGVFGALLPTRWPITAQDLPVLVAIGLALRTRPEFPQRIEGRRLAAALKQAGLRVTSNQRLRFELPVSSEADAREVVESLYLPGVAEVRRQAAVQTLAAREGRVWVPVPLRRVLASKPRI